MSATPLQAAALHETALAMFGTLEQGELLSVATSRLGLSAAKAPAAPSFTATPVSGTQVNLSWGAVSGATGYLVDEWINGAWKQIGSFGSGVTGDAVTGLSPGVTYCFDVAAYDSAGASWANYRSVTTLVGGPPAAPSFTATPVSGTQINLSWGAVSGAKGYLVDEWINGAWKQIGSFGSGVTGDAVTGLSPGTTYYFDVAAYDSAGASWANYQSATTKAAATATEPSAATAYSPVSGSLFGANGLSYLDVHQGDLGDCWLMASLAEVAARDPADIQGMFTAAGTTVENGSTVSIYKVRLYNGSGVAGYFTVDTELPSGGTYYDQATNGVLWAALAEKAYAEANGAGWVTTSYEGSDSYNALNGGDPSWALQAITGKPANDFSINPANIAAAWKAGQLIVLGSSPNANDNLIVGDSQGTHAYAVVNYVASSSNPFELYNPWGVSSVVGSTVTFNGRQVYGGPFYANATLISRDFAYQFIGTGTEAGTVSPDNGSREVAGILDSEASSSVPGERSTGTQRTIQYQAQPVVAAQAGAHDAVLTGELAAQSPCEASWLSDKAVRPESLTDAVDIALTA
jgi:hypothetical protein